MPFQEAQIAEVENEIAQDSLKRVTTNAKTAMLRATLEELESVIKQKNEIITRSETEGVKRNAIIERKQQIIDQFNKKLEQMISQAGVSTIWQTDLLLFYFMTYGLRYNAI